METITLKVVDAQSAGPLKGALSTLDGVMELSSDPRGEIPFRGLRSREHQLYLRANRYKPARRIVSPGVEDTVRVQLTPEG